MFPISAAEAPGGLADGSSPVGSRDEAPVGIWQGRRHGFESGGQILRAKRAENFLTNHFLASGGQNIAEI